MTNDQKLIVDRDEAVLRAVARAVDPKEIGSKKIRAVLSKMKKALHAEDDGVAIAAPQVGEGLRIFVVSGRALDMARRSEDAKAPENSADLVFINPEIIKVSQKKKKMEEGCLSLRYLYGQVSRHEKVTITALDEEGEMGTYDASGLVSQIFQHEIDHLDGILFIDKAENIQDLPPTVLKGNEALSFVFFGSSIFSAHVLKELEVAGLSPVLKIESAKDPLPMKALRAAEADVFVVASFGKILPKELLEIPPHGVLNVHPSLLPELRGPAPIQGIILDRRGIGGGAPMPGVTIIKMDEKVDHGPIVAQAKVELEPWPDHYHVVEEKLGRAGGRLLATLLPDWINGKIKKKPQDESQATYIKLIKKEDGLIELDGPAEENYRKVLAYSTWPGAYLFFKSKTGKEIRVIVKDAKLKDGKFTPARVIPAGKKEMDWPSFLHGNA